MVPILGVVTLAECLSASRAFVGRSPARTHFDDGRRIVADAHWLFRDNGRSRTIWRVLVDQEVEDIDSR